MFTLRLWQHLKQTLKKKRCVPIRPGHNQAKMIVKIHPIIKDLVNKYRGKDRVFNFYERFSSMADLNRAIDIGLKEISKELDIENFNSMRPGTQWQQSQ